MKQIVLASALALTAVSASAEDQKSEGLSLLERGAEMLLRGIIEDIEPAIDDMAQMAQEFGPQITELVEEHGPKLRALMEEMGQELGDFLDRIDDFTYYEAPEVLPNGDIIIRRKPDAPAYLPDSEIEL